MKKIFNIISGDILNDLKIISNSENREEERIAEVNIAISITAILALSAFVLVLCFCFVFDLSMHMLVAHSFVSLCFYFTCLIIKKRKVKLNLKKHILGIMISLEYIFLFFMVYKYITNMFWFTLLLIMIPLSASSLIIILRYMYFTFFVTIVSALVMRKLFGLEFSLAITSVCAFVMALLLLITYIVSMIFRATVKSRELKSMQLLTKNEELYLFAYTDFLTGLPNREAMKSMLEDVIVSDYTIYIVDMDIDDFKKINESTNHRIGDNLLVSVSLIIKNRMEKEDILYRISGDEFVCVVNRNISEKEVHDYVKYLIEPFKNPFSIDNYNLNIRLSCGIVKYPEHGTSVDELIKVSAIALQKAKEYKQTSIFYYNLKIGEKVEKRINIEKNLIYSILRDEFFMVYQPIIANGNSEKFYFEALIRWVSPTLGFIPPNEFIEVAEKIGFIHEIGLWIIEKACDMINFLKKKYSIDPVVSINVSPLQLKRLSFKESVKMILEEKDISNNNIILEFTETAFIDDDEITQKSLRGIKELGIYTSIDDFGTGYSSFNYLPSLPVDIIKIDKSFVDKLEESRKYRKLVKSIIALGHDLGMELVAEGVETEKQLQILNSYDCDYIQGYYYSKPLNAKDLECYLDDRI